MYLNNYYLFNLYEYIWHIVQVAKKKNGEFQTDDVINICRCIYSIFKDALVLNQGLKLKVLNFF